MIKDRKLLGLAIIAVLAACGGGGGSSVPTTTVSSSGGGSAFATPTPTTQATVTPTTTPTSSSATTSTLPATISITLAKGTYAAGLRRSQTIGTGTQSIAFRLLQQNGASVNTAPQVFGLTSSSPNCTVNLSTGALNCVLQLDAPLGSDVYLAQTYTGSNGTGTLTGSGAVALNVAVNSTNTASIVLNAQVAAVYVVSGAYYLGSYPNSDSVVRRHAQSGFVSSTPIFFVAVDAAGNTILNPSAFNSPIYLQLGFYPGYTADVTLAVTYAANDPAPCTGTGVTVSSWYASFPVCSPSDSVNASLSANGGTDPSYFAYVYGWTSASQLVPTPAPSMVPYSTPSTGADNSYAQLYVTYSSGPTPTPSPTPTPTATPTSTPTPTPSGPVGSLPVIGQ